MTPGVSAKGVSGHFWRVEVNAQMIEDLSASARLFDLVNSDDAVIDALERLLDTMRQSRQAKTALASLPPDRLRAVLRFRATQRGSR